MLVTLGFLMISTFIVLLMTRRLAAMTALVLVPFAFALIGGFGPTMGPMVVDGIRTVAPTAVLIIFAMLYFLVMTDAGMFDPLAKTIVRAAGGDPVRIFFGTITLGFLVALDGDGATVYMIVLSAMLPLYKRIGLSIPMVAVLLLHCTGLGNLLPWGGPTARAAVSMKADMSEVFNPLVIPLLACVAWTYVVAYVFGLKQRKLIGVAKLPVIDQDTGSPQASRTPGVLSGPQASRTPGVLSGARLAFNWVLTIALIWVLVSGIAPMALVFMVAASIALVVNFPNLNAQRERLATHAPAILAVASLIFAASVFTGVLNGTGMAKAMAEYIVQHIPASLGPYLAVVTAIISIPVTWMVSNDVFYFGMLPVLAEAASHYGITPAEMARAGLIGQPVHILSPLVASTYLLVGMLDLDYAKVQRFTLPFAIVTCLVMLVVSIITGVIPAIR